MSTNFYFQSGVPGGRVGEQRVIEDLIIESIKIYGFDLYYLPRTEVNTDNLFGDDTIASYDNAIPVEAYLENVDGFGGDGELMSKFGIEIRDTASFVISRGRWEDVVGAGRANYLQLPNRPSEGDLLYMPLTKSYFEIKKVDATNPFYQLGKLHVYKLQCELWQYSSEKLDTGIAEIDSLEDQRSLSISDYHLRLESGDRLMLDNTTYASAEAGSLLWEGWTIQQQDTTADNEDFNVEALDDILDFTEINPFGEVIRNNV
jgi:hypothetical protein